MNPYLALVLSTAALAAVVLESPVGVFLRVWLAGAPREPELAAWREGISHGLDEPSPKASLPWLDKALQCAPCVTAWAALGSFFASDVSPCVASWGLAWFGGWILIAVARFIEARSE